MAPLADPSRASRLLEEKDAHATTGKQSRAWRCEEFIVAISAAAPSPGPGSVGAESTSGLGGFLGWAEAAKGAALAERGCALRTPARPAPPRSQGGPRGERTPQPSARDPAEPPSREGSLWGTPCASDPLTEPRGHLPSPGQFRALDMKLMLGGCGDKPLATWSVPPLRQSPPFSFPKVSHRQHPGPQSDPWMCFRG